MGREEPRPAERFARTERLDGNHAAVGDKKSPGRLGRVVDHLLVNPGDGFIFAANVHGDIVGVAAVAAISSVHYAGQVAWLEEHSVLPDWRQRGIGTALVSAALQRAQEFGMVAVGLDVDARNERVVSLYARLGFSRVPRSTWVKVFGSR